MGVGRVGLEMYGAAGVERDVKRGYWGLCIVLAKVTCSLYSIPWRLRGRAQCGALLPCAS